MEYLVALPTGRGLPFGPGQSGQPGQNRPSAPAPREELPSWEDDSFSPVHDDDADTGYSDAPSPRSPQRRQPPPAADFDFYSDPPVAEQRPGRDPQGRPSRPAPERRRPEPEAELDYGNDYSGDAVDDYETAPPRRRAPRVVEPEPVVEDYEEDWDDDYDDVVDPEPVPEPVKRIPPKGSKAKAPKTRKETAKEKPKRGFSFLKKKEDSDTRVTEDTFIDEKNLKIKPFGRKDADEVRASEFDRRANMRSKANTAKYLTIGLVLALVAFGAKNAIIPPKTLSEAEVGAIVSAQLGDTGFPQEKAGAFAVDFMRAYLTIGPGQSAESRALNYFYTGTLDAGSGGGGGGGTGTSLNRASSGNFSQKVLAGPTLYNSTSLTPSSGAFTIGALVQSEDVEFKAPEDGSAARWAFFNVSVVYDEKTNTFRIAPDSPNAVPATEIPTLDNRLPEHAPLASTDLETDQVPSATSTITGFIKAWATSTVANHESVDQFIIPDAPVNLKQGMGGRYTLSGNDANDISVDKFYTDDPTGLTEIKAKVTVRWMDAVSTAVSTTYSSTYVITLQKQANGMYLVSSFAPFFYTAADPVPGEEQ